MTDIFRFVAVCDNNVMDKIDRPIVEIPNSNSQIRKPGFSTT